MKTLQYENFFHKCAPIFAKTLISRLHVDSIIIIIIIILVEYRYCLCPKYKDVAKMIFI